MAYFFSEDSEPFIEKTLEIQSDDVSVRIFYSDDNKEWAERTMTLVEETMPFIGAAYDDDPPHDTITIRISDMAEENNYPFSLGRSSDELTVAVDYPIDSTVWGLSKMWIYRGNSDLPEWVYWGTSSFNAYWALEQAGRDSEASAYREYLTGDTALDDTIALDGYELPDNAADEPERVSYYFRESFLIYERLYEQTSIETLADIYHGTRTSQSSTWSSARYIQHVQGKTDAEVNSIFEKVYDGSVESEVSRWTMLHYAEIIGALLVVTLIFMWTFWSSIKGQFSFLSRLKERNPIQRELIKRYKSKDRILMEMESYFRRKIPDDQYDALLRQFYNEKFSNNSNN
ncbi:hypothetical protein EF808_01890 [archaeon]|nr:MAG: hypothetical protein EF808_01890 [archaeon]